MAKGWLATCKLDHKACNGGGNAPRRLPTRLICVESFSDTDTTPDTAPDIKLALTDAMDVSVEYLALSHCWGLSKGFRLLEGNYDSCLASIDRSLLTKNMQDAISITRVLGYSYIWIDSLCIIQDSEEDWKAESARMLSVYAGAACTLAATASASGDGGFFRSRLNRRSLEACEVGVSTLAGDGREWIYVRRDDLSDFRRGVDLAPLNGRGWVLQERLLSRRILHFGADMLYWECCLRSASELCPLGYVYKKHPEEYYGNFLPHWVSQTPDGSDMVPTVGLTRSCMVQRRSPQPDLALFDHSNTALLGQEVWQKSRQAFFKEVRRHSFEAWSSDSTEDRYRTPLAQLQANDVENEGNLGFAPTWYAIVELYTRTSLTFSTDKFIAIQGIVDEVQRATKYRFIAGMWEECLVECLVWFVAEGPRPTLLESVAREQPGTDTPELSGPPMAPSWSWVAVDGPISVNQHPVHAAKKINIVRLATSCSAMVSSVRPGPAGEKWNAIEGVLEIVAPLVRITRLECERDKSYYVYVGSWGWSRRRRSARLLPDLVTFGQDGENDAGTQRELFCISLLLLRRGTETVFAGKTTEVQGLVVQLVEQRADGPDIYKRIGFFSTGLMEGGSGHVGLLKNAPAGKIHIK